LAADEVFGSIEPELNGLDRRRRSDGNLGIGAAARLSGGSGACGSAHLAWLRAVVLIDSVNFPPASRRKITPALILEHFW